MHDTLKKGCPEGVAVHALGKGVASETQCLKSTAYASQCFGQMPTQPGTKALPQPGAACSRDACKSDAATCTAAGAKSAGVSSAPQAATAATATTADTLTNQRVSSDGANSTQQLQQQSSAGAVWQLATPAQQQQQQQQAKNPDQLVKMLFAAALQNGMCKPQQQVQAHQQASYSTGSLMSPAVSSLQTPAAYMQQAQLQLLHQQQQQMLGALLQQQQQAASVQAAAAGRATPSAGTTVQLASSMGQPALVALQQRAPIMLALAPIHTRLPVAAGMSSQPQPQPLQAFQQQSQQAEAVKQSEAQLQQQHLSSPRAMHAALGDRAFYSIRSLLLAQQDMFVQQLFELHRLARVQAMAWAEVMPAPAAAGATAGADSAAAGADKAGQASKHQAMTKQYGIGALAAVRSASARSKASGASTSQQQQADDAEQAAPAVAEAAPAPKRSVPARSTSARMLSMSMSVQRQQYEQEQQEEDSGAFAITDRAALAADDVGAAAVVDLPVHLVLLANVPWSMRKAVSQPHISNDYSRLNSAKYYVRRSPGVLRPTAMRYMADAAAAAGAAIAEGILASIVLGGPVVALAAAATVAAAAAAAGEQCTEPTVQPGMQGLYEDMFGQQDMAAMVAAAAAPVLQEPQHQQRMGKRPPQRSNTARSLSSKRPAGGMATAAAAADVAAAAAAAAAAAYQGVAFHDLEQPSLAMPPPPPLLPELAAQHFAAAAAQHQLMQQQQQQLQYEDQYRQQQVAVQDQEMQQQEDLDAAAVAAAAQPQGGLNVFRPMPQIDPSFASRFLAGGAGASNGARQGAGAAAAAQFDPHSYWMSKHYGAAASASQQQWPQQPGLADGTAAAAAVGYDMSGSAGYAGGDSAQAYGDACSSGLANMAAAAAAAAAAGMSAGPASSQQANDGKPLVHWWQDAKATFGEIGLIDPNAMPTQSNSRGGTRNNRGSSGKRGMPQQASSKKRTKHAAGAYQGYDAGWEYAPEGMGDGLMGYGPAPGGAAGAFKPPAYPSQERSRVRSNALGVSRAEASVGSDNSASSLDNPAYAAAAAAAAAAELGPDAAEGVLLLHHMSSRMRGNAASARRGGRGGMSGASAAPELICQGSVVAGSHHAVDKSAAGILMSLSNSRSTVD